MRSTVAGFLLVLAQAVVVAAATGYIAFSTVAQGHSNSAVIAEIRDDINIHAAASADRNCAVAKQLDAIIQLSRGSVGPAVRHASRRQLRVACAVVTVPESQETP